MNRGQADAGAFAIRADRLRLKIEWEPDPVLMTWVPGATYRLSYRPEEESWVLELRSGPSWTRAGEAMTSWSSHGYDQLAGLAKPPQLLSAASGKSEEWTLRRDRTYEIRTYEDAVRVIEQYGS